MAEFDHDLMRRCRARAEKAEFWTRTFCLVPLAWRASADGYETGFLRKKAWAIEDLAEMLYEHEIAERGARAEEDKAHADSVAAFRAGRYRPRENER
jgi:hypothetical protein